MSERPRRRGDDWLGELLPALLLLLSALTAQAGEPAAVGEDPGSGALAVIHASDVAAPTRPTHARSACPNGSTGDTLPVEDACHRTVRESLRVA